MQWLLILSSKQTFLKTSNVIFESFNRRRKKRDVVPKYLSGDVSHETSGDAFASGSILSRKNIDSSSHYQNLRDVFVTTESKPISYSKYGGRFTYRW